MRSPPAPTGGVRSTRRPRLQFACPVLCGQYLTRGNGHLCVSISSWAEEVRLHTVQPPQLGSTPSHPPGRPRRGGRSVCVGQVRRLRDASTSRPLTAGGPRHAVATGSAPQLWHLLRPRCGKVRRRVPCHTSSRRRRCAEVEMPPNYRGLLAIIPPVVLQGSHQPISGPKI